MLAATDRCVYWWDGTAGSDAPRVLFDGAGVRRIAEGQSVQVVALTGDTLILLSDGDQVSVHTGIEEPVHALALIDDDPFRLLVGTEPPFLYRVSCSARRGCDPLVVARSTSFDDLPVRDSWHTPWGGPPALRSLAVTADGWAFADIHVGSIMRSADGGVTWEPVTPQLHEDVHQVATSRAADDRVYANTYRAVYVSDDRGQTWAHRATDLGQRYGRAMAVHPNDPDVALATVSDGPHGENVHGQLFRTDDAGHTWTHVQEGFPGETLGNIDTYHVAFGADGTAWAVVGSTLYIGRDDGTRWARFWTSPRALRMLASSAS